MVHYLTIMYILYIYILYNIYIYIHIYIILYITRATLMSPGKDETTRVCEYIYIYVFMSLLGYIFSICSALNDY